MSAREVVLTAIEAPELAEILREQIDAIDGLISIDSGSRETPATASFAVIGFPGADVFLVMVTRARFQVANVPGPEELA